jgi:hypothetical protein
VLQSISQHCSFLGVSKPSRISYHREIGTIWAFRLALCVDEHPDTQLLSRSDRLRRQIFQLECGGDRHTVADRPRHRAAVGVEAVDPLRHLAMFRRDTQMIGHVNAPHHQHPTFGLDLSRRLRRQIAFASWDLARRQRAPEGAGQSASRRGD